MPNFPSFTDNFASAANWTLTGATVTGGELVFNTAFNNAPQYKNAKSADESMIGKTWIFQVTSLPTGNANAQMWVNDSTGDPGTGTGLNRIGFEYVGAADRMDFIGQTAAYAAIGTTVSVAAWSTLGHSWFKLVHTGTQLIWYTSPDGLVWTERRTMAAPAFLANATCEADFEAYWNAAGAGGTFKVDNVNLPPALPVAAPTGADALQTRTINEAAAWKAWLTTNGARGFVGEYATVGKWDDFGDAAQQTLWNSLADKYLSYLDFAQIDSAYWASGREFDAGYPLGLHVGTTQNTVLNTAQAPSATVRNHPSRYGVVRAANLAGHEHGVTIAGPGTVRSVAGYYHTAADFAFLAANGVTHVRLPISWERIQPTLSAALSTTELTAIDTMIGHARTVGIEVILDIHNYGRYTLANNTVVAMGGTLTQAQFNDLWTRISTWVKADANRNRTVIAYGLMNEPNALTGGAATWEAYSQSALNAIRTNVDTKLIYVSGYNFSSLTEWADSHPDGWITDSANNFAYEAHHYWDSGTVNADGSPSPRSGQYQQPNGAGSHETMTYAYELAIAETEIHWAADLAATPLSAMGYSNWQTQTDAGVFTNNGTLTPPVVDAPGTRPGTALEMSVDANTRRNEVVPNHRDLTEGDSVYFSQSFYLGAGFPLDYNPGAGYDGYQIIDQIHQAWGSHSPPIAIEVVDNQLKLTGGYGLSLDADPNADPTLYQYTQALGVPITTEKWYDLVYFIDNFSETAGASTVTVWVNGAEVLTDFVIPPPTLVQGDAPDIGSYRKHGMYHSTAMPAATIYQAGMAAGMSYAEVDPDDGIGEAYTGLGSTQSASNGSGVGTGTHTNSGSVQTISDGSGEGEIAYLGVETSVSSTGQSGVGHTASHYSSSATGGPTPSDDLVPSDTFVPSNGVYASTQITSSSTGSSAHSGAHVSAGVENTSVSNIPPGTYIGNHFSSGEPVVSISSGSGDGNAYQKSSAGIARPNVGMVLRKINPDNTPGDFLPDWTEISYTEQLNATGTVAIKYAKNGLGYSTITAPRFEGALFDGALEVASSRFIVTQTQTDAIKEDESGNTVVINAPLLVPSRLAEATVYPDKWPSIQTAEKIKFSGVTPGYIIGYLINKAKARGAITEISQNWSSTKDSANRNWANVVTMELDPGGSIMSVIEKLVDMRVLDWDCHGRELRLWEPSLRGQDRTIVEEPCILHVGRDILDAPEKRDSAKMVNTIVVTGKDGKMVELADTSARSIHGRIEGFASASDVDNTGTLTAIGQAILQRNSLPMESFTHELSLFNDFSPQPWVDYYTGDWIGRDVGKGAGLERYRVVQLTATYSNNGTVTGAITLGTRFDSTIQKLTQRIDALTNSNSSAASAPAEPYGGDDEVAPSKVTGLIASSDAYTLPGGGTRAAVRATWTPVATSVDGSELRDLDRYEVRWRDTRYNDSGSTYDNEDLSEAACEILYWILNGHTYFEDLTYYGCSANLRKYNDVLLDMYNGDINNESQLTAFLQTVMDGYRPPKVVEQWQQAGETNSNTLTFSGLPVNTTIILQARAVDRSGNLGDWSDEFTHVTARDDVPPPVPTTPVMSNYLGVLRVDWDGKGVGGVDMPEDFIYTEVHASTGGSGFTPTAATQVDTLNAAGTSVLADLDYDTTYFVRLVSVDTSGNKSVGSTAANASPKKLVNIDLGPNAVERLQIKDGEIVTAKIADLAVNNAKIADLSVGKLTAGIMSAAVTVSGRFTTSLTGNRVEFNSAGIRKYDAQNNITVDISNTDTYIAGRLATSPQGGTRVLVGDTDANGRDAVITDDTTGTRICALGQLYSRDAQHLPVAHGLAISTRDGANVFAATGSVDQAGYAVGIIAEGGVVNGARGRLDINANEVAMRIADDNARYEGFSVGINNVVRIRSNAEVRVISNDGAGWAPLGVGHLRYVTIAQNSARELKTDFSTPEFSGLEVARNLPVEFWRYKDDEDMPLRLGPMVDDMPEFMHRSHEDGEGIAYNPDDLVGVLLMAIQELDEKVTGLGG